MRKATTQQEYRQVLSRVEVSTCAELLAERARIPEIFSPMEQYRHKRTKQKAAVVGGLWHLFSASMPGFLCTAAGLLDNNQQRFSLVQIIWEELGSGHPNDIHAQMFRRVVVAAGVSEEEIDSIQEQFGDGLPLASLSLSLHSCREAARVLGLCAGLEAPAKENIELLFDSLSYAPGRESRLADEQFFKLHRVIEGEHICLGTSNYMRFCTEPEDQKAFLSGFDAGVDFFRAFWRYTSEVIERVDRDG